MKRGLHTFALVGSLILSGMCVVGGVVSYVVPVGWHATGRWGNGSYGEVGGWLIWRGSIHFVHTGASGYVARSWSGGVSAAHVDSLHLHPTRLGFALVVGRRASHFEHQTSVPVALPAAVFALVGVSVRVAAVRRGRRGGKPECVGCGYDLTGNMSGVCPECGAVVAGEVGA